MPFKLLKVSKILEPDSSIVAKHKDRRRAEARVQKDGKPDGGLGDKS